MFASKLIQIAVWHSMPSCSKWWSFFHKTERAYLLHSGYLKTIPRPNWCWNTCSLVTDWPKDCFCHSHREWHVYCCLVLIMFRGDKAAGKLLSVLQSYQTFFWTVSLFLSLSLFDSLSLSLSYSTIPHWWQCTASPPSLMEASVCYDNGIPPVAKFTEKEIHIIVRQSQALPMGMFVRVSAHQLVYMSVCVFQVRGPDECAHHLLEQTIICESTSCLCLFCQVPITEWLVTPIGWCVRVHVGLCGRLCVRVHKNLLILMDQQDRSAGLKRETNGTLGGEREKMCGQQRC